jgi:hypothetical protein
VWHRIRWGNVGRLCAALAVLALVVAWPRLASPPPRVGGDEPIALAPKQPPARPRKQAPSKSRPAPSRRPAAKPRQPRRRPKRREAKSRGARRVKRPSLGGGMVDARPVAPDVEPAVGAGGESGTGGGATGGASLSPPPAPPDPAAAEFGPER